MVIVSIGLIMQYWTALNSMGLKLGYANHIEQKLKVKLNDSMVT